MKIILLGASGIIGSEIDRALSPNHEIVRAGRNGDVKVDYTDTQSVKAMLEQVGKFDALVVAVGVERERGHLPVLRGDRYRVAVDVPLD